MTKKPQKSLRLGNMASKESDGTTRRGCATVRKSVCSLRGDVCLSLSFTVVLLESWEKRNDYEASGVFKFGNGIEIL